MLVLEEKVRGSPQSLVSMSGDPLLSVSKLLSNRDNSVWIKVVAQLTDKHLHMLYATRMAQNMT